VLAGHETIDQSMADPVFARFAEDLMAREIAPHVPDVPGVCLEDYQRTLLRRFANRAVGDRLARLCERGSTKIPSYLAPSIVAALDAGGPHALLALAVAGWLRFYRGHDAKGRPFEVKDALIDTLGPRAREMGDDPSALLAERAIFGDLGERPEFVASVRRALRDLDRFGPRATVAAHVSADRLAVAA
jgi:fructuronate reductase/mannitol 2-dehydrogenase